MLVRRFYRVAGFTVAAIAPAGVIGVPGMALASPPSPNPNATGTVVYIVNNSSQMLAFDSVERFINIAGRSDTVEPGETGWVKGTEPYGAVGLTYVVGDPQNGAGSAQIGVSNKNGVLLTECTSNGNVVCLVTQPPVPNGPSQVTVQDR